MGKKSNFTRALVYFLDKFSEAFTEFSSIEKSR